MAHGLIENSLSLQSNLYGEKASVWSAMLSSKADIFFHFKFFFCLDVAGMCPKQGSSPSVLCVTE